MNTIEWLQARVEDLKVEIQLLSESIKRSESEISIWTKTKEAKQKYLDDAVIKRSESEISIWTKIKEAKQKEAKQKYLDDAVIKRSESEISIWTKIKEAKQKDLDDRIKIQQQLSLIIDQMILAENPEEEK